MTTHALRVVLSSPTEFRDCVNAALAKAVVSVPLVCDGPAPDLARLILCIDAIPDGVEVLAEPAGTAGQGRLPMRLGAIDDFAVGALLAALAAVESILRRAPAVSQAATVPTERPAAPQPVVTMRIQEQRPARRRSDPRSESDRPDPAFAIAAAPDPLPIPAPDPTHISDFDPLPALDLLAPVPPAAASEPAGRSRGGRAVD